MLGNDLLDLPLERGVIVIPELAGLGIFNGKLVAALGIEAVWLVFTIDDLTAWLVELTADLILAVPEGLTTWLLTVMDLLIGGGTKTVLTWKIHKDAWRQSY